MLERAERLGESFAAARADERDDVVAARERPGDRDLRDRRALRLRERAERLDEREVALEVLAREARCGGAEVVRGQRVGAFLRPVAGEQAAGEHAVGGDADAELAAGRQDLVLDPAREQRVLDLQVGDRVHGVGAADGLGADLGEADVADVAGLHELRDRADRLLDRDVGEDAAGPVDVDVVGAEPAKRVGEEVLHRRRAQVVADDAAVGPAHEPELDAEHDLLAIAAAERVANQQLVVPHPVVVARVEQRDPGVERRLDGRDALRLVGRTVEVGHAHAAEAERRHLRAVGAE